jgi:transposase-like protein
VNTPKSLLEATRLFSNPETAHAYLRDLRWPDGVIPCPTCGNTSHYYLANQRRWKCKVCKKQFSVKVGTIFEDSPLPLDKWLLAVWLITNAKNGISSCEIHRALEVTQKTAWFMLHRIRLAMQNGSLDKLADEVEVDETYIGGKSRNMHKSVRAKKITGSGMNDKAAVFGMLERGGEVRTKVIGRAKKKTLQSIINDSVIPGSRVFSDALRSYNGLEMRFQHQVIDHAFSYVDGIVHTNGMENYWSLLKRALKGTYISVEPFHLHRYLDEQAFRFNERKENDGTRFDKVGSQVGGKRLTYKKLTGKELAAEAF